MASISVIAVVTEIGRNRIADMLISGRKFQIVKFVVGQGGHDTGDPSVPLTPNPSATVMPGQTFGPKPLTITNVPYTGTLPTPFCAEFSALLDYTEANGPISDIGLIGKILDSPIVTGTSTVTFDLGNNWAVLPSAPAQPYVLGQAVRFGGSGVLPTPLTAAPDLYYVIPVSPTQFRLAASYTAAITNIPVTLAGSPSGSSNVTFLDPLLNSEFLFAYGNRPLLQKTDTDQFDITIDIQI